MCKIVDEAYRLSIIQQWVQLILGDFVSGSTSLLLQALLNVLSMTPQF